MSARPPGQGSRGARRRARRTSLGLVSRDAADGQTSGRRRLMSRRVETLSADEARRVALAAQGFDGARNETRPTPRQLIRTLDRLGLLQIDSVNVLVRSHYIPLFSRLGAYDAAHSTLRRTRDPGGRCSSTGATRRRCCPWRSIRSCAGAWRGPSEGLGLYRSLAQLGRAGALTSTRSSPRWPSAGALTALRADAGRAGPRLLVGLERRQDRAGVALLERPGDDGHPPSLRARLRPHRARAARRDVLAAPTPTEDEAHAVSGALAARALGVATARDLRDYFRLAAGRHEAAARPSWSRPAS